MAPQYSGVFGQAVLSRLSRSWAYDHNSLFVDAQLTGEIRVIPFEKGNQGELFLVKIPYSIRRKPIKKNRTIEEGGEFCLVDKRFYQAAGRERHFLQSLGIPEDSSVKLYPWETEYKALGRVSACFGGPDSDYHPVPGKGMLFRKLRSVVRPFVQGTTLEDKISTMNARISISLERMQKLVEEGRQQEISELETDMENIGINRDRYISATVKLCADIHKELRKCISGKSKSRIDAPGGEEYADDVVKHLRHIFEGRGIEPSQKYLDEIRRAFLETKIAEILNERETPIVYDLRPSNIVIRETSRNLEDRSSKEMVDCEEVEKSLVVVDWGKFRLGLPHIDLITLLYNVQLDLRGDQIEGLVGYYLSMITPKIDPLEYAGFLRKMKMVAVPTLIHAADSEDVPEYGQEHLRKAILLLREDISGKPAQRLRELLEEVPDPVGKKDPVLPNKRRLDLGNDFE